MVNKYKVVTLCGSSKFKDVFEEVERSLSLGGYIVLRPSLWHHQNKDDEEIINDPEKMKMLMDLHRKKIDISDAIYVINEDNYIGEATQAEIDYARSLNKPIMYHCVI